MKNIGFIQMMLCAGLLGCALAQEAEVSALTIAPEVMLAPCPRCAEGYAQYCVKMIVNCVSYRVPGDECLEC
jgi:hypothetical protein